LRKIKSEIPPVYVEDTRSFITSISDLHHASPLLIQGFPMEITVEGIFCTKCNQKRKVQVQPLQDVNVMERKFCVARLLKPLTCPVR
jgi:hypothetical protein